MVLFHAISPTTTKPVTVTKHCYTTLLQLQNTSRLGKIIGKAAQFGVKKKREIQICMPKGKRVMFRDVAILFTIYTPQRPREWS